LAAAAVPLVVAAAVGLTEVEPVCPAQQGDASCYLSMRRDQHYSKGVGKIIKKKFTKIS
jgi:hypothetical protein